MLHNASAYQELGNCSEQDNLPANVENIQMLIWKVLPRPVWAEKQQREVRHKLVQNELLEVRHKLVQNELLEEAHHM
jgi:hypothetical protein